MEHYWKLRLNEKNFKRLVNYIIGIDDNINPVSIINNVIDHDYSTIEEVFVFLRKRQINKRFKDVSVEGALLGDFVPYEEWEKWCEKDIYNRYPNGEFLE